MNTINKYTLFKRSLLALFCFCLMASAATAQISLTATLGTTAQTYTTLGAAFTAINNGTHKGVITISVTGNTTESFVSLNASGAGSASYTKITISPSGGAARSISGSSISALISLNGADNVVIDGLNTGGNSLTISNTSTSAGSITIQFTADASNNKITNCTITGGAPNGITGVITFGTATTTGNDFDTISNCTITDDGGNTAAYSIYSAGTASKENNDILISGNNIANYFAASLSGSAGVMVSSNSTSWTIQNNRFYQTSARTLLTGSIPNAINVKAGSGHTISGNIIGYGSSTGTGTYSINSSGFNSQFYPISLAVGTSPVTSVQGNTIAGFSFSTMNNAVGAGGPFSAIYVSSGSVDIGTVSGNTIGAASGTGSIVVSTGGNNGPVSGIALATTGTVNIQNNTIGGITCANATAATGGNVVGIYSNGTVSALTISGNTIGNTTADNMAAGTASFTTANTNAAGIYFNNIPTAATISGNTIQNFTSNGTGSGFVRGIWSISSTVSATAFKIKNNTVKNLSCAGTNINVSNGQMAAVGINISAGTNDTVSGNTIFNIQQTNTGTANYYAAGITLSNATNTVACNNTIYGISNAGTGTGIGTSAVIAGILIYSGTTGVTVFNNMVSLGSGITTNTSIIGIMSHHNNSPNPTDYIYHNTVNITGTVTSGALPSFCFHRGDFNLTARTATVDVRNNIFTNDRTGGTGKHYAIGNNYNASPVSATGWGTNASDYNVLNAAAATVGYWGADKTFATWQTTSASDANSYSGITVTYVNTANDLRLNMGTTPTLIESGGATISNVTTDIDGQVRPGPASSVNNGAFAPDLGADEIDGTAKLITWSGATNTNWNTATNWLGNTVPGAAFWAKIPTGLTNYPDVASGTATITSLIINSGGSVTVSGGSLQVAGSITNNGTFTASAGGTIEMNGSTAQTIAANTFAANTIANLKVNNSAGVTLGGALGVTGDVIPTSGTLTTGGFLTLKSSASGTGRIAAGSTSGGYISGNVTVERYISGKRAYRFLAHPFSTSIALSQLTDDIDITGSGGSTNGFTTTTTNNASSFWYNVTTGDNSTAGTNPGWTAFTNTNGVSANAWATYSGARIMVRGAIGEGLNGSAYTPSAVTLDMSGAVNQGNVTVSLTKGTNTNFVFVGNPFPSQVNMDAVSGTNTGSAFYIWDATQGTRGGYTAYTFGSSSFNLPSCGSFVTTLSANGSMLFEEGDKTGSTPGTMFKTTGAANTVQLRMEDSTTFWDRLLLRFDNNATATVDYPDAAKLYNPDISFYTRSKDDSMLSIDARPYVDGEVIKLGLYANMQKNFKIVAADFDIPAGTQLFLHDKFLNKTEEITGAGYEYWFAVAADPASWGDNRFELNTKGTPNGVAAVNNESKLKVKLVPNPATDNVTVYYEGVKGDVHVTVTNMTGITVAQLQQAASGGSVQVPLRNIANGVYMVTVQNGSQTITQRLVVSNK